jgi:hypothetical protein
MMELADRWNRGERTVFLYTKLHGLPGPLLLTFARNVVDRCSNPMSTTLCLNEIIRFMLEGAY